jgi:hypothetical protein
MNDSTLWYLGYEREKVAFLKQLKRTGKRMGLSHSLGGKGKDLPEYLTKNRGGVERLLMQGANIAGQNPRATKAVAGAGLAGGGYYMGQESERSKPWHQKLWG